MRDDAVERFAEDVGQIEGDADGERIAEIGRCVMVPARAVPVAVAVIVTLMAGGCVFFRDMGLRGHGRVWVSAFRVRSVLDNSPTTRRTPGNTASQTA